MKTADIKKRDTKEVEISKMVSPRDLCMVCVMNVKCQNPPGLTLVLGKMLRLKLLVP